MLCISQNGVLDLVWTTDPGNWLAVSHAKLYSLQNYMFCISRAAKTIHCAQNVKTVRLCTEFNKSINNIFSDMPHLVAFPRWSPLTFRVPHASKIETCSDFSEN